MKGVPLYLAGDARALHDAKVSLGVRGQQLNEQRRLLQDAYANIVRVRRHVDLAPIEPPFSSILEHIVLSFNDYFIIDTYCYSISPLVG